MNKTIHDILFALWGIFCCLGWLIVFFLDFRITLIKDSIKPLLAKIIEQQEEISRLKGEPMPTEFRIHAE